MTSRSPRKHENGLVVMPARGTVCGSFPRLLPVQNVTVRFNRANRGGTIDEGRSQLAPCVA
jgi:hypothetical protein